MGAGAHQSAARTPATQPTTSNAVEWSHEWQCWSYASSSSINAYSNVKSRFWRTIHPIS